MPPEILNQQIPKPPLLCHADGGSVCASIDIFPQQSHSGSLLHILPESRARSRSWNHRGGLHPALDRLSLSSLQGFRSTRCLKNKSRGLRTSGLGRSGSSQQKKSLSVSGEKLSEDFTPRCFRRTPDVPYEIKSGPA